MALKKSPMRKQANSIKNEESGRHVRDKKELPCIQREIQSRTRKAKGL